MKTGLQVLEESRARGFQAPMVYVYESARWEYRILSRELAHEGLPTEEELNALGADGWDLAGVISQPDRAHFYFKRLRS